jgi:hypothetical protein
VGEHPVGLAARRSGSAHGGHRRCAARRPLARAAGEVRRAERQRLDVATATLGVRIVLPPGLVFLPAFVLTTVVPIVLALAHQVLVTR